MIKGLLASLIVLFSAHAFADEVFGGVGIVLSKPATGYLLIEDVLPNSPAEAATVPVGGLILSIDAKDTKDMSINGAVDLIRGTPGTNVALQIQTFAGVHVYTLTRALIHQVDKCFLEGFYRLQGIPTANPSTISGYIGNDYVDLWVTGSMVHGFIKGESVNLDLFGTGSFTQLTGWIHGVYVRFTGSQGYFTGHQSCIPNH